MGKKKHMIKCPFQFYVWWHPYKEGEIQKYIFVYSKRPRKVCKKYPWAVQFFWKGIY